MDQGVKPMSHLKKKKKTKKPINLQQSKEKPLVVASPQETPGASSSPGSQEIDWQLLTLMGAREA